MTNEKKIERAIEILEAKGLFCFDVDDAVRADLRVCDGKDTPTQIARRVSKQIKATA